MDESYHDHHYPLSWVFCDLLDYYYGQSARALLKERGMPRAPLLLIPLAITRPFRIKWDWDHPVRRTPVAPIHDEDEIEAELIARYGKTSWELADEAEQGYDV